MFYKKQKLEIYNSEFYEISDKLKLFKAINDKVSTRDPYQELVDLAANGASVQELKDKAEEVGFDGVAVHSTTYKGETKVKIYEFRDDKRSIVLVQEGVESGLTQWKEEGAKVENENFPNQTKPSKLHEGDKGPNDKFNLAREGHQGVIIDSGSDAGKTIVFYDISGKYLTPYGDEPIAPERALRKSFKRAVSSIEEVANIEFFDINHLSRKDRKYLNSQNVEIPDEPHIVLQRHGKIFDFGVDDPVFGMAGYPRDNEVEYIDISKDFTKKDFNYYQSLDGTTTHEALHTLGLIHSHEAQDFPKEYDNTYNTRMSYNSAESNGKLGAVDIYSLREEYGENPEYNFHFSEESLVKDVDPILGLKYDNVEDMIKNSPNIDRKERKEFYELKNTLEENGLSQQDIEDLKDFCQFVELYDLKRIYKSFDTFKEKEIEFHER